MPVITGNLKLRDEYSEQVINAILIIWKTTIWRCSIHLLKIKKILMII